MTYTYDPQGNRTSVKPASGTATTLTYDQANRLTGYGTSAAYAYNGDDLRTSKTFSGTTTSFTWDQSGQIPLLLGDGGDFYVYGEGGTPVEKISGTTITYLHQDQQGSTRLLTDGTGAVAGTYTYDPYGKAGGHTGTSTTPLQYDGQYTDAESGYQYLRARYYDPSTAQFLSVDPAQAVTLIQYGYAANDPLNNMDALGLLSISVGCALGGLGTFAGAVGDFTKEGLSGTASVLGRILRISPSVFARSYAGSLLRSAGSLAKGPLVKSLGRYLPFVGSGLEFGSDIASGDSGWRAATKTGMSAAGGAAGAAIGATAGGAICGAGTIATLGAFAVACPFVVPALAVGVGYVGSRAGEYAGGIVSDLFGW